MPDKIENSFPGSVTLFGKHWKIGHSKTSISCLSIPFLSQACCEAYDEGLHNVFLYISPRQI